MSSATLLAELKRQMYKNFDLHSRGFEELVTGLSINNQQTSQPHSSHFNQALSDLYSQNPHLLQQQLLEDNQELNKETSLFGSIINNRKKILNFIADYGPFLYFSYEFYKKYCETYQSSLEAQANQSWLQKSLRYACSSIVTNVPNHINFFLTSAEFLIQAYLIKLLLKMIIFGFF